MIQGHSYKWDVASGISASGGNNFVFLKVTSQDTPRYARSNELILEQGNDLHLILQILKRIAGVMA